MVDDGFMVEMMYDGASNVTYEIIITATLSTIRLKALISIGT